VKEWVKLTPDQALQDIMLEAIRNQKRTVRAMIEGDRHHILDPERWIKYKRWQDEISEPAVQVPKGTQETLNAVKKWREMGPDGKSR
jgi:hypothetical protein